MNEYQQVSNAPAESNQSGQASDPLPSPTTQSQPQVPQNKSKKKLIISLIIAVLVLLIGGAAYMFFMRGDKQEPTTTTSTQQSEQPKVDETSKEEEEIPPNSKKFEDAKTGLTFYYTENITGIFKVSSFKINEDIGMGYGAPFWWRYTTSNDSWQTYQLSDKSTSNNVIKVKTDNTYKILKAKVEGNKVILDHIGEGGAASNVLLFGYNGKLYKIDMPQLVWNTSDDTESEKTDAQNALQKKSAEQIVETIKFN